MPNPKGVDRYPIPSILSLVAKPNLTEHDISIARQLHEDLFPRDGANKTKTEIRKAKKMGFKIGAKAKLRGDSEIGEVVGYNENAGGFYPGSQYPVLVKFERGTFEYSTYGIELVTETK